MGLSGRAHANFLFKGKKFIKFPKIIKKSFSTQINQGKYLNNPIELF
jgi:hypothetical protein